MAPAILEGSSHPKAPALRDRLERWLPVIVAVGILLPTMHQSSLGTLMLIAPTKMSPLWNTNLLPLLFLMSAIMVGFPMVILESIYANISFGRKAEMQLLTPLSRFVPWFLGAYGILKFGDLALRWKQLDLWADPGSTIALEYSKTQDSPSSVVMMS